MKDKVLVGLIIFPTFLIFYFIMFLLRQAGEFVSIDNLIKTKEPYLLGLAYSNPVKYLKLHAVIEKRPDVIALGSSRVMPFRAEWFNESFYNAGGAVTEINDLNRFLGHLPDDYSPKIIIVGLDQYRFNAALESTREPNGLYTEDPIFDKAGGHPAMGGGFHIGRFRIPIILEDWLIQRKFRLGDILNHNKLIGFNAIEHGAGFREDGNYEYGNTKTDKTFSHIFSSIEKGDSYFKWGDKVSENVLDQLQWFLVTCHQRNIKVILFFPPYADAILQKMKESGHYGYMENLGMKVRSLVGDCPDFKFYDFSDIADIGFKDSAMIDGFHANEAVYKVIYEKIWS